MAGEAQKSSPGCCKTCRQWFREPCERRKRPAALSKVTEQNEDEKQVAQVAGSGEAAAQDQPERQHRPDEWAFMEQELERIRQAEQAKGRHLKTAGQHGESEHATQLVQAPRSVSSEQDSETGESDVFKLGEQDPLAKEMRRIVQAELQAYKDRQSNDPRPGTLTKPRVIVPCTAQSRQADEKADEKADKKSDEQSNEQADEKSTEEAAEKQKEAEEKPLVKQSQRKKLQTGWARRCLGGITALWRKRNNEKDVDA